MDVDVVRADRLDFEEVRTLLVDVYPLKPSLKFISVGSPLVKNLKTLSEKYLLSPDTSYGVLARHRGKLVGFNGFLGLGDCKRENQKVFQSCDTATAASYRGRGIFSSCLSSFQSDFQDAILFGMPNSQSLNGFIKQNWNFLGRIYIGPTLLQCEHSRTQKADFERFNLASFYRRDLKWFNWRFLSSPENYIFSKCAESGIFNVFRTIRIFGVDFYVKLFGLPTEISDSASLQLQKLNKVSLGLRMLTNNNYARLNQKRGNLDYFLNPRPIFVLGKNLPKFVSVESFELGDWDVL